MVCRNCAAYRPEHEITGQQEKEITERQPETLPLTLPDIDQVKQLLIRKDGNCLAGLQAFIAADNNRITVLQITTDFDQRAGSDAERNRKLAGCLVFVYDENRNTFGSEHKRIAWYGQGFPGIGRRD